MSGTNMTLEKANECMVCLLLKSDFEYKWKYNQKTETINS